MLADRKAAPFIDGVAWHCYGGDVSAQTPVHAAHPDKNAYLTECSGGEWDNGWADSLRWFTRELIIGSTRGWSRGIVLWNLALDEKYGPHAGGCGNCRGVVTIDSTTGAITRNLEYYVLGHASRFVMPGAHRIESTTGVKGLATVAFQNADGSMALDRLERRESPAPILRQLGWRVVRLRATGRRRRDLRLESEALAADRATIAPT